MTKKEREKEQEERWQIINNIYNRETKFNNEQKRLIYNNLLNILIGNRTWNSRIKSKYGNLKKGIYISYQDTIELVIQEMIKYENESEE